ncbi:MAG: protein kinase [Pirellulaceae bacterium]|nr:protein kinase [Pirellulaceae bacterium]
MQASRIEILEEVDSGLYGKVYKAHQTHLDRIVAVKIIKPEWTHKADAVEHAGKLAKVDRHPNIVTT